MKQSLKPESEFDYTQLAPLNSSLEQLFATGTPQLSSVFEYFTNLHTISLGEYQ